MRQFSEIKYRPSFVVGLNVCQQLPYDKILQVRNKHKGGLHGSAHAQATTLNILIPLFIKQSEAGYLPLKIYRALSRENSTT